MKASAAEPEQGTGANLGTKIRDEIIAILSLQAKGTLSLNTLQSTLNYILKVHRREGFGLRFLNSLKVGSALPTAALFTVKVSTAIGISAAVGAVIGGAIGAHQGNKTPLKSNFSAVKQAMDEKIQEIENPKNHTEDTEPGVF